MKKINKKRGSELVESLLMTGIALALIVIIFYPRITALLNTSFTSIETWFTSALNTIGI
jgi:Na+-transporting NADH:ubiquinone oxidoreductase subunit NqrB